MPADEKYPVMVFWDFDGPINNTRFNFDSKNSDTYILAENLLQGLTGVYISYRYHLETVFKILHDNGVISVPASQRCAYKNIGLDGALKAQMYQALDECFGDDRNYLLKKARGNYCSRR
ncbi:hypothetical protein [Piscirickettsia litoralis]|uniref:Uncharacterized protein n=1 Tax=Piscirickettsia litoralis TaxID=1891921 RepID=A0ABX3A308_9GAMM|nr:hypothetical protein [Piscirickettsia litoralis]ODN41830.1 hypothetical protein BGC07_01120 [Piscirickettsia litoralis]